MALDARRSNIRRSFALLIPSPYEPRMIVQLLADLLTPDDSNELWGMLSSLPAPAF